VAPPVAPPEASRLALTPPQAVAETTLLRWRPPVSASPGRTLLLGHGAGSSVRHGLLGGIAAALAARGDTVVGFNFADAEAGRRFPDPPARLEAAFRDALAAAAGQRAEGAAGQPLVLGGRSMGGRIASHLAAQGVPCAGLALLGYPLHPAGRPQPLRTAHWPALGALRVPLLFVQGDRDRLCDLDVLERERRLLGEAPVRLHVLAGADHEFRGRGRSPARVAAEVAEVAEVVAAWAAGLPRQAGPPPGAGDFRDARPEPGTGGRLGAPKPVRATQPREHTRTTADR